MKNLLLVIILLIFSQYLMATEAILQLDTQGHTAKIKTIITTKSGDIITCSDDKTIRVWDSKTGKERRRILGQIGKGSGGINTIALSPDEKYLAVGGFFGNSNKSWGDIRIYHYATGKLVKLLKSHANAVSGLSFSEDGIYLISGSVDNTAKIWDVSKDFVLKDTISFHGNYVTAVKIIKRKGKYFAITVGYDGLIVLYDIQKRKVVKDIRLNYRLKYLAVASNLFGGRIAVCGFSKEIVIYDFNLKFIKRIKTRTVPAGLDYSENGKLLIAGASVYPYNVNIYQSKKDYRKKASFRKHTNLTKAVALLGNRTAVSAGGDNNEIYLWDAQRAKLKKKIAGVGEIVWSVGIKGETLGWGNKWTGDSHTVGSKLQKTINLKTFEIDKQNNNLRNLKRISAKNGTYSLAYTSGGDYGYKDAVLILKRGQKESARITRNSATGYRHNCYGFYKKSIISGGSNGVLKIYNFQGKEIANLVGHTGAVWSIALDGDRLVSGSDDQTIRMWNLSGLDINGGGPSVTLYPMLNIFTAKNNEWVIWSKSGYFASSINGDQYVGYHINQDSGKEAYFVSSAKYYDKLYRPDIIEAIVKTGSEKRAINIISSKRKVEKADVVSEMPPILLLLSKPSLTTGDNSVMIKFSIESASPVEKMIVTVNGRQLKERTLSKGENKTIAVSLDDGENIISIRAGNKYAMSDAILIRATKKFTTGKETVYKPTLYLLSIGVSRYKNSEYNLEVADKDAKSIVEMFKKQEGKIYKKVVVRQLLDDNATKDNILDALDWVEREVTQRDMVIIFAAGHGVNDDKGNYYFMGYDSDVDKLRRTAIRWIEIEDTISGISSKVILMVDTCHSGNVMGREKRRDITGAIKSIINSGTGSVIMTASTGRGYSMEKSSWGHGAFTKAFLEGLDEAKADYNNNNTISIKEIDLYVTNRVKILTKGKQKPTTIIPDSVPDFALGVK